MSDMLPIGDRDHDMTTRPMTQSPPGARDFSVWIVEDNALFRESFTDVINDVEGLVCPCAFESCEEALAELQGGDAPEMVLMDIGLPGIDGVEGISRIHAISPTTRVLMLTVHEDQDNVFNALCAGAAGYVLKPRSADQVVGAIQEAREGGVPMSPQIARRVLTIFQRFAAPEHDYGLTRREAEVLELLVEGQTQKTIAKQLFVSEHTVNTHVRNIYAKLHVHTRSGAVAKALKERLV